MKNLKKIMAAVLVVMMIGAMAVTAYAVNITITRDSSFDAQGASGSDGNNYKWYRIFTATPANASGTTTEGGSGSWYFSGTAHGISTTHTAVSYVASQKVYEAITNATGNNWFELTQIAGTNTYSVKWKKTDSDFADIQAAAEWLISNNAYDDSDEMSAADGKWTAEDLEAGYYVIESLAGKNLIAATTDINIKEKNVYPSVNKEQKEEDNSSSYTSGTVNVAVGDKIDYQVTVKIPATAKVNDQIKVSDTASTGLELVTTSLAPTTLTYTTTATSWETTITVDGTTFKPGDTVVITFKMTVTKDALTVTEKKNEAKINYGNSGTYVYESKPVEVEYKTYMALIVKTDGNTNDRLPGVKFTLKEGDSYFPVTGSNGVYVWTSGSATSGSSVVETNGSGTIIIRGLDSDKTYTLTEIETVDGYNMLSGTVTLVLTEDTGSGTPTETSFTNKNDVKNFKGSILPSTGGIGTTIFYVVGAVLVIGSGIVLVTKKRMGKEEN